MKLSISLCLAGMVIASSANAVTIVDYISVNAATNAGVAASTTGVGVTDVALKRSIGLVMNTGGTFNSRGFDGPTTKADAVTAKNSIYWGFDSGTQGYDLTNLSFAYDRSGTGPLSIAVDFFIDTVFQAEIFSDDSVPSNSSGLALNIDLSAYDNVANGFFRLTGWSPLGAGDSGTFDIENRVAGNTKGIILTGELTAVPLPAAAWLFGSGLLGLVVLKRKRS